MRFAYAVLATAVALLASSDSVLATTNSDQTKLASVLAAENPLLTRSLTAVENGIADKRLLRAEAADSNEESSFMEKAKFYYWYTMGRTPGYVYQDFFKGVDRSIVLQNPNYKVWERYKAYYDEKKGK
ncbi:hypothetical protein PHYPSEUDO_004699 [Phytophthora pseudosyringae]|uniref:RxLR effector protein n=1 Tax=Phytophthora pseudosyringae TaxID=221518 RepID=A0A8T1VR24_9STRA|nr:hypothetical protein PHYPSEUDO_004699 [Phytophthora pseudosyringae]